jgi:hypothetical protein
LIASTPASMMIMAITQAKIGRLMKNLDMEWLLCFLAPLYERGARGDFQR